MVKLNVLVKQSRFFSFPFSFPWFCKFVAKKWRPQSSSKERKKETRVVSLCPFGLCFLGFVKRWWFWLKVPFIKLVYFNSSSFWVQEAASESKPFSAFKNPFWSESSTPKTPEHEAKHKLDSKGIGLAIVDSLKDDCFDPSLSKPVLFGSQLRVQIPSLPNVVSPAESPRTPPEFSIKTRTSQLSSLSSVFSPPVVKSNETLNSPRVFIGGSFSASEMELSEDYTCVITHGSNPRTTHIFDDCIVETCCGVVSSKGENGSSFQPENFLSFCFTCRKNLSPGKDIYIYRGEKAFCSEECRYQEMMLEEGTEKPDSDDMFGTYS
ncbi:hypothetical protein V6N13_070113 [Hibiscus sabdariffa]